MTPCQSPRACSGAPWASRSFHPLELLWTWTFSPTPRFGLPWGKSSSSTSCWGGDNAVVIALACRKLPPEQRSKGIAYGTAGAIVLRLILIMFAMTLLQLPFLKVAGAVLLVWIGVKLIAPNEEGHEHIAGSEHLLAAIKTIIIADLVMSVDNVIAIAGAAQASHQDHQLLLISLGLLISIPIIVWGSQIVIKLMERFPFVVVAGGMLLGWIAGGMLVTDPAFVHPDKWLWLPKLGTLNAKGLAEIPDALYWAAHLTGAALVLGLGKWLSKRKAALKK